MRIAASLGRLRDMFKSNRQYVVLHDVEGTIEVMSSGNC